MNRHGSHVKRSHGSNAASSNAANNQPKITNVIRRLLFKLKLYINFCKNWFTKLRHRFNFFRFCREHSNINKKK